MKQTVEKDLPILSIAKLKGLGTCSGLTELT